MDTSAKTVVKVSSPADILGVLPYRLGFHPTESIVVVCLQGPRKRDVLVMRLDLLPCADDEAVAMDLVERAMKVCPSAVVLACYTDEAHHGAGLARSDLTELIEAKFARRGVEVVDALLVSAGRWWSYVCRDSMCCSPAGSALPPELTAAARFYAAESVGSGGVLLRDRAELVASVRPPDNPSDELNRQQYADNAARLLVAAVEHGGITELRALVLENFANLLEQWCAGDLVLPPQTAALILLGLRDKRVRDEVITSMLDADPDALLALLVALAATAEDDDAAPICTVLGWVAYSQGDGALANVAIERALDSDPGYELARLVEGGLDAMVSPEQVRGIAASVREDLRAEGMAAHSASAPTRRRGSDKKRKRRRPHKRRR